MCWQDLGPDVCSVPCLWEIKPEEAERADIALAMPIYTATEAHGRRLRPGQSLAIFSLEPVFGWGPRSSFTKTGW